MDSQYPTAPVAAMLVLLLCAGAARADLTALWANDGADKVKRSDLRATKAPGAVLNGVWDGQAVRLFAARDEVVAFTVILESGNGPTQGVTVQQGPLDGPDGQRLTTQAAHPHNAANSQSIQLFRVGYLPIKGLSLNAYSTYDERHIPKRLRRKWRGAGVGRGGWDQRPDAGAYYPDIAEPLTAPFDIPAGQNQAVWIDVHVPRDTPAGTYRGTLRVTVPTPPPKDCVTISRSGCSPLPWSRTIPVEVEVLDFALPKAPALKTMAVVGYAQIAQRYLGEKWPTAGPKALELQQIRDRHFQMAHRHRVSLIDADEGASPWPHDRPRPEWLPRLDGSLFTAKSGYKGPGEGVGNGIYSIGTYGQWGWKGKGPKAMADHAAAWVTFFETSAPQTDYFLYLADESDDTRQLARWVDWLDRSPGAGARLPAMATLDLPTAAKGVPALEIAATRFTVGPPKRWASAASKWRKPGKKLFVYNGFRPGSGTFCIEDDGIALRQIAWAQHKLKIDRWFYWETTYYDDFQGGRGPTNVFETAQTFGGPPHADPELGQTGWNYANGDGVLFYPGTDRQFPKHSRGLNGPMASLRLKHWRRGIQDGDYLALAAAVDPAKTQAIVNRMVPAVLWEIGVSAPKDPTWVRRDISWSVDPDDWRKARRQLAQIILSRARTADQ